MAFTDPVDFDPGTGSVELARVISGFNTSSYSNPDGTILLKAEHNYARRTRRVFRVDVNKITADPFIPSQNSKVSASMYLVADLPVAGYDVDELADLYAGINTCLTEGGSTNRLAKWLGGQS